MFCRHCGKSIVEDSVFCSYCGKPQGSVVQEVPPPPPSPLPSRILFSYSTNRYGRVERVTYKIDQAHFDLVHNSIVKKLNRDWKDSFVAKIMKKIRIDNLGGGFNEMDCNDLSFGVSIIAKSVYEAFMEFLTENNYTIRQIGHTDRDIGSKNDCIAEK